VNVTPCMIKEKLAPISEETSTPEFCGKAKESDKFKGISWDEQSKLAEISLTAFKLVSQTECTKA